MMLLAAGLIAVASTSPVPPPPNGQWSDPHAGSWCQGGVVIANLGKGFTLAQCKSECLNRTSCVFISHADQTDGYCELYGTCPKPVCGATSRWFTSYEYGRDGAPAWTPCAAPPPPPPTPPKPGAMSVYVVPQSIVDSTGAKCLDGTPPAYKIRKGTGDDVSKFIVFMEGGGWCFGISDCSGRREGSLGSSKSYVAGSTQPDVGGVMSFNKTVNPDFYTWTMVFVHYCDGSSFSSYRPDPIMTAKGEQMWMRGKANLQAVLEDLGQNHGMDVASEVVLSGGSAGGLATYYHVDYVADFVKSKSPKARVTGFPDAGYFADLANTQGVYDYRGFFISADPIWNTTMNFGSNRACLEANAGNSSWKCLMAQYLTDYIETPMYVMNAAFDVYQIQHILEVGCVRAPCNKSQVAQIEDYRKSYLNSSIAHLIARASVGHGAYIDSCVQHEQNLDYCGGFNPHALNCAGWTHTLVAGLTPQQAYSAWYKGIAVNNMTIDTASTTYPQPGSNPSCPYNLPTGL